MRKLLISPRDTSRALSFIFNKFTNSIDFKYTWYKDKKKGEGAVDYIMKYILKTFKDYNNDNIQLVTYWYVKYRIIRFLTSRCLTPLFVY
jgi:hypothetical protein